MRAIHGLAVALVFFSSHAAFAQKVTVDSDKSVDLTKLKTFTLGEGLIRSPSPVLNTELMKKHVHDAISETLVAKGLRSTADMPDLKVSFILGSLSGRRRTAAGGSSGPGMEGNLIVEFRNAADALVWHGVATVEEESPAKVADKVDGMVKKLFAKYPK